MACICKRICEEIRLLSAIFYFSIHETLKNKSFCVIKEFKS